MINIYTEKKNSKDWILQNDLYFNLNTGNEEMSQKEIDLIRQISTLRQNMAWAQFVICHQAVKLYLIL